MEELEKKLSYESGQIRFDDRGTTWDMRSGIQGHHFEHTEKSIRSDSSDEELRALDKEIKQSNKKLEKLDKNRRIVRTTHIKSGTAENGIQEKPGRGRLYSRSHSSRLKQKNPELDPVNIGMVRIQYRVATRRDYQKESARLRRRNNRNYVKGRLLFRETEKALGNDRESDEASTDSLLKEANEMRRRSGRLMYKGIRRKADRLQVNHSHSINKQYDAELERNKRLQEERRRLSQGKEIGKQNNSHSVVLQAHKKRIKKQQVTEHHKQNQRSFSKRVSESRRKVKKVRERAVRTKRTLTALFSGIGIAFLFTGIALILLFVVLAMVSSVVRISASFISMNDYGTMTTVTETFNDKCTNLYMYLNIDRDKHIEPDLEKELNQDIYEFIYDVDGSITYNQIDLVAYLSAKYGSFTLDMVETELAEIFAEMFVVETVVKVEQREVPDPDTGEMKMEDKNICYVTLKITSFDNVITGRLTDGQKNSYLGYRLSSCGQQVMNPVMEEDWTTLISSPFGSRYHPIHKEYRMHNGVDIAVPTGTKVYAAVSGEVTAARYSDSAGYMVSITDENGYTVTYMHLSSYSVAVGQKISAGQMVALSGNTGNSTGPHLHLAVQDSEGNYLNPVFLIPQTCEKQN